MSCSRLETIGTRPEDTVIFSAFTADHVTLDRQTASVFLVCLFVYRVLLITLRNICCKPVDSKDLFYYLIKHLKSILKSCSFYRDDHLAEI